MATDYGPRVSALLAEKLRVRGTLDQQVKAAAHKLPRKVYKAASTLSEAMRLAEHPKFARQVDEAEVRRVGDLVIAHLEAIDPWDRFKGRLLTWLGWISGIGIIAFICAIWYARQNGMI